MLLTVTVIESTQTPPVASVVTDGASMVFCLHGILSYVFLGVWNDAVSSSGVSYGGCEGE